MYTFKCRIGFKGWLKILIYSRSGRLKGIIESKNLIVNTGISAIAGLINGVVTTPFKYVALGTGTTPPSETDTALENEVARASASVSRETTTIENDTAVWDATLQIPIACNISEAGIFDSESNGVMLARQTFDPKPVEAGDVVRVIWKIQVTRV